LYCLVMEGVDGLILETYYDVRELKTVLEIAREETDIPIIISVSMHEPGDLENGQCLNEGLNELEELGSDVTGINCRLGPSQMVSSLETVPLTKRASLAAYPNASLPAYRDGVLFYENEPDYLTNCAVDLRNQGVRLIGGGCATKPEHLRTMEKGNERHAPLTEKLVKESAEKSTIHEEKKSGETRAQAAEHRTTSIVEWDAPNHLDISEYMEGGGALNNAG